MGILASAKDSNMKAAVALEFFGKRQKEKRVQEIYEREFQKQYDELLALIKKRTKERIKEAEEEKKRKDDELQELTAEEAEKQKAPLGPGGLDPTEVLNSLPKSLQDAFMSKDIEALKKAIAEIQEEEAQKYMDQCVQSGLWVSESE